MSWTPTDAQVIEVKHALKEAVLYDQGGDRNRPVDPDAHLAAVARAVLVAVGPDIAASAWSDGMEAGHDCTGTDLRSDCFDKNPYREKEAGR